MTKEVTQAPAESRFTKAQAKRFNELQAEFQRAQRDLQLFINYLVEEHGIDPESKRWTIGERGFVEQIGSSPNGTNGANGTGHSEPE